jgi:hypothetical protein
MRGTLELNMREVCHTGGERGTRYTIKRRARARVVLPLPFHLSFADKGLWLLKNARERARHL